MISQRSNNEGDHSDYQLSLTLPDVQVLFKDQCEENQVKDSHLSGKNLATPYCFAPYLINVERKEYWSICLETAFIAEEFCIEILAVVAAAEEHRGRIYSNIQ